MFKYANTKSLSSVIFRLRVLFSAEILEVANLFAMAFALTPSPVFSPQSPILVEKYLS